MSLFIEGGNQQSFYLVNRGPAQEFVSREFLLSMPAMNSVIDM